MVCINVSKNILICVAWPYVNNAPHMGHIAGMNMPADIFARYHRQVGNNVVMVSGSDMHGTPTALKAIDEGVKPEDIASHYHQIWSTCFKKMGFSYDIYTHTHTDQHKDVVHGIFKDLNEKGYFYESTQLMPYSNTEKRFLSDRFVEGICPHCKYEEARGDQCDSCGRTLDPIDLIDIRSKRDGSKPEFIETTHVYFNLSNFQSDLENWISKKDDWRPNVRNQTINFLKEGLIDRAITRDIEWGITVPIDGYEQKRIYVWFEAVMGYYSATKLWAERNGNPDAWENFWKNPNAESYYFQGKDNIPFHTIIWPAILLAHGNLNLPTDIVANEYLNLGTRGFSKSRGHAVWLPDYLERYEVDPLRYYLSSVMPETSDSEFTWEGFLAANNNELVATLGNFVHRILTITNRNFDGIIPDSGPLEKIDAEALKACETTLSRTATFLEARRFRDGLNSAMSLARHGNQYIDSKAPWVTVKTDLLKTATTMWVGLNIISTLSTLFYPFLPSSSQKMKEMLGFTGSSMNFVWKTSEIIPGTPMKKPKPLFRKLDESLVETENARLET